MKSSIDNLKEFFKKFKIQISLGILLLICYLFLTLENNNGDIPKISPYPNGKDFAFTITDDPDGTKLEAVRPIYQFLNQIGMKTTIAVWAQDPLRSDGIPDINQQRNYGDSCEKKEYLEFIKDLQKSGFEIALHTASAGNDTRDLTEKGYETFKTYFGSYPKINIMHSKNLENIYWGKKVVGNNILKYLIGISSQKARFPYSGEIDGDKYFWGDICKEKTKYVRLWGTSDINTLKFNHSMPYHDPAKPYVNYWFSFSDGYDVEIFKKLISEENIKLLQRERGASIVYTHFSANFTKKNERKNYTLDIEFSSRMRDLSKNDQGWFVPASILLDRLLLVKNINVFHVKNGIVIANSNNRDVEQVTIITTPNKIIYDTYGNRFVANSEGEIVLDKIEANNANTFFEEKSQLSTKNRYPGRLENINLVFKRMLIYIRHRIFRW